MSCFVVTVITAREIYAKMGHEGHVTTREKNIPDSNDNVFIPIWTQAHYERANTLPLLAAELIYEAPLTLGGLGRNV